MREITQAERKKLRLSVGTRIKGKPMVVKCGMNRIERTKTGEVRVDIGYFSAGQILARKLWEIKFLREITHERQP